MRWRFWLVGLVLALGLWTLASVGRVSKTSAARAAPVRVEQRDEHEDERTILVFIDSLSREVATDARRMPALAQLARHGASFEVEPCRDQLTYLCLRAVLTGHDDSSLLAIADNFRPAHEGPPQTLLSALAAKEQRVVVVGSSDFHPYRAVIQAERALSKQQETAPQILAELAALQSHEPKLSIVSLSSGDMAAHAHGTRSAEYDEAFRRIDGIVAAIAAARSANTNLIVFGDHGHDEQGRHLPGTASKTWALYHGPAFRSGVSGRLHITDHRALLGVVLGVATEPTYGGPALSSVFEPSWVRRVFAQGLPRLTRAQLAAENVSRDHWLGAVGIAAAVLLASWIALWGGGLGGAWLIVTAALVVLTALVGFNFDAIRSLLHDHGGEPERGIWLLLPLGLACVAAPLVRAHGCSGRPRLLRVSAACIVLVTLLLLLPTAYYYGSRRAIVLGSIVAIAAISLDYLRRPAQARDRLTSALSLAFAVFVLATYYPVRQLGPETAGAAAWALDAALYERATWLTLLAAKLVLCALVVIPSAASRPFDTLVAVTLFGACLLLEVTGVVLPRSSHVIVFGALLVGMLTARKLVPSSLFATALLLLPHLYGGATSNLAALQLLLAATAAALHAFRHMRLPPAARSWACGLTAAVASYLMFWPTVGFHLVGIDFAFMFRWVRPEDYERAWWLIGLGVIVKLALPSALVVVVARAELRHPTTARVFIATLAAKALALCVMIASYAVYHDMSSQQALAMLAELCLVLFGVGCAAVALPLRQGADLRSGSEPGAPRLRAVGQEY